LARDKKSRKKSGEEIMANAVHFATAREFRRWLEENHAARGELTLRLYKTAAKREGITYAEALDEALCFGWIDGVRRSLDAGSYSIRFTPRKANSIWSRINVGHVERLKAAGKMSESGLRAFELRQERRTGTYAFEQKRPGLTARHKKVFQANAKAWKFFAAQAPWYQRTAGYWVSSAKQEQTQQRRLAQLMKDSGQGRRLAHLTPRKAAAAKTSKTG
jgi:uncharacterized protein YdeI (YjbR/CyaY-like superfamily)